MIDKIGLSIEALIRPVYQVLITKRYLSQLYGRSNDAPTPATDLERKVDLCRQLLAIADVLDAGRSQFRGFTLYDLYLGQLGLALAAEGAAGIEQLTKAGRAALRPLLEDCLACLAVESGGSYAGRVAAKASAILEQL